MTTAERTIGALAIAGAGGVIGGPAVGVAIGVILLGISGVRKSDTSAGR